MSLGAEDRIQQWLRRRLQERGIDRIGDDGAILPAGGPWAVTQDHQIAGVHFPAGLDPSLIARRSLAVNVSDLIAMGAEPAFAFLALSCPPDFEIRRFLSSFVDACETQGLELAGGDLARNDKVAASLTLLGRRFPGGRWLKRSHGRPGDLLWVAGDLGLSAVGRDLLELGARLEGRRVHLPAALELSTRERALAKQAVRRHLVPRPQVGAGRWLAFRRRAAAIDVSDGLALDLHRLCRESGVGAQVEEGLLPARGVFRSLCLKLEVEPIAKVLAGGEDYALLFTLPPRIQPPRELDCTWIGRIDEGSNVRLISRGRIAMLPPHGWDHFGPATGNR